VKISLEQVRYVAELARLELDPAEQERLTGQLNAILAYMEQLGEVDTGAVAPTSHVLPLANVLREDEPRPCLPREEALAGAPDPARDHFGVPKVIE